MNPFTKLTDERLQHNANLGKYTAARLGGTAEWLYVTQASDPVERMVDVIVAAWDQAWPVRVLGGGANVLIADKGVAGLVVVNRSATIQFGDWHDGRTVSASSGTGLLRLARACAVNGIAGMEWAVGVPGTVGGAVVNNAGAHGDDMAASIAEVVIYDAERGPQMLSNAELTYDYRSSALKTRSDRRFVVLQANFILPKDDPTAIKERMAEFNAYRKRTQPPGASLGSIFKNPTGDYAGRLIEVCGLKGHRIGNAQVSPKHANFFVNIGDACASDYYALIQHVQAVVHQREEVWLEPEIELIGVWN